MVGFAISEKKESFIERILLYRGIVFYKLGSAFIGFLAGRIVFLGFLNPFSLSLLCASMAIGSNVFPIAFGLLIGAFILKAPELFVWHLITMVPILILYAISLKTKKKIPYKILCPILSFLNALVIFYIKNYYLYDMFMIIIQSLAIFALANIYEIGLPLILKKKKRRFLSIEEKISLSLLILSLFLGSSLKIYGVSLKIIVSIFLIYLFSYKGSLSAGAAIGIVMGIFVFLSNDIYSSAIGVYGICGLTVSFFKKHGRIAMILSFFIANAVMTFFINGLRETLIGSYEIIIASILFILVSEKSLLKIISLQDTEMSLGFDDGSISLGDKKYAIEKLKGVSNAFQELSISVDEIRNKNNHYSQIDAAKIIQRVTKEICLNCGMYENCWGKGFYDTYQRMFKTLDSIENHGIKQGRSLDNGKDNCLFPEEVWMALRYNYGVYKASQGSRKNLDEARLVFARQMKETSEIIDRLSDRLCFEIECDKNLEKQIYAHLDKMKIDIKGIRVFKYTSNIEIDIEIKASLYKQNHIKTILQEVRNITNRALFIDDLNCHFGGKDSYFLRLKDEYQYSIATGISRIEKQKSMVSGDNYSFVQGDEGKFHMILSDGMGSGPRAALESSIAINLLEKFLAAGYDQNSALEYINSFLVLRSDDDNYATLDISIINQYTGDVEFIKVGAVSTFIKRKDRVEIIRDNTFPAGVFDRIDIGVNRRKVREGDFIIMITDGVLDANSKDLDKEKWLSNFIQEIKSRNPQRIAEQIMKISLEKSDNKAVDDMTILVAKVWK